MKIEKLDWLAAPLCILFLVAPVSKCVYLEKQSLYEVRIEQQKTLQAVEKTKQVLHVGIRG